MLPKRNVSMSNAYILNTQYSSLRFFSVNHPCNKNNGGCSHLCLFYEDRAVCSCTKYLILGNNEKTCERK